MLMSKIQGNIEMLSTLNNQSMDRYRHLLLYASKDMLFLR